MDKKLRMPIAAILLLITPLFMLNSLSWLFLILSTDSSFVVKLCNSITYLGPLVVNLVLAYTLFTKKRNNSLLLVLACATFLQFITIFIGGSGYFWIAFTNFLSFAAYGLLLVFALPFCEQTFFKADTAKIKAAAHKFFYLPSTVYMIGQITQWINPDLSFTGRRVFSALLNALILLSIAFWLRDPYTSFAELLGMNKGFNADTPSDDRDRKAYCNLGMHIVLCLLTCGIWNFIWTYRATNYLNKAPDTEPFNPTSTLLLCIFVPFYRIYWFYKHGQKLDALSKQKRLSNPEMATMCLLFGIFIPIVAYILMQDRINTLCTTQAVAEEKLQEAPTTEQLRKYKTLLDEGVITQEEFDAKKKQLLGL